MHIQIRVFDFALLLQFHSTEGNPKRHLQYTVVHLPIALTAFRKPKFWGPIFVESETFEKFDLNVTSWPPY